MSIEQRVRIVLREAASHINLEEVRPAVGELRPRRSRRPLVAFVSGFAVVAALGVAIWLLAPSREPDVATPSPPTFDTTADQGLDWERIDAFPDRSSPVILTEGPAGWLVMAPLNDRINGWPDMTVLRSDDGVEWAALETAGFAQVVHIGGVIGTETLYVAYGLFGGPNFTVTTIAQPSNFPEPAVWTSVDGTVWDLVPLPRPGPADRISDVVSYRISDVAVSGDLMIAVGIEFDEDLPDAEAVQGDIVVPTRQVIWATSSSDEWRVINDDRLTSAQGAAAGPAGIITTTRKPGGGFEVWNTTDGGTWQPIGAIPDDGFVASLEASATGYVTLLSDLSSDRLWSSTDGATWALVDDVSGSQRVTASPGGFVVVSASQEAGETIYWSPDGQTWRTVATSTQLEGFINNPSLAAISPHAVIVFGHAADGAASLFIGTQP